MELNPWFKPTALLCAYGFFTYVKPSEPFLTPYLLGPVHNLTESQVLNEIYPVWIYSYMSLLIPVFLLTDYLKYKPVIFFQGIGLISCWLLLLFGRGLQLMQLMQVFYAVATSCEIGYYSYIYSIVDKRFYQKVTSYVRASTLIGSFIGSLLSQLLVSLANLNYFYLNVISLVGVSIAFIVSWFLPMPKKSMFFFAGNEGGVNENDDNKSASVEEQCRVVESNSQDATPPTLQERKNSWKKTLIILWKDLKSCYSNLTLLRWSVWWALSTCGWLLVVNYVQNLWETIRSSTENEVFNGAVESVATVLGGLGAFSVGYINVNFARWGELSLGLCSLIKCGLLMAMYWTTNIWICYVAYVVFIIMYNIVITITQFQIAVGLNTKRFALVFGANTFMAVGLNTLLTIIIVDKAGLGLNVNIQFMVYSVYFGVVALIFFSHVTYFFLKHGCHSDEEKKTED